MLKVGLIGCGGMGSTHAECWLALADEAKLVAIADIGSEKSKQYAQRAGAKLYTDAYEMLEKEELDAVDICLPTFLHTEYAIKAMEKGLNVFMEKPVCLNEEEAKLLLDAQKRTGARVQIGQVIRFKEEYAYIKDVVEKGTYGKVISASFLRLSQNPSWSLTNWYNDYTKSGTSALDLHVHDTDFIRYMMGREPLGVQAIAERDADGVIQQISTAYDFGDAIVTAEGGWSMPSNFPFTRSYRVKLEKATVVLDANGTVTVYEVDGEVFNPEIKKAFDVSVDVGINVSALSGYYIEIKYFIDTINGKETKEIAPLIEGIESARLVWKEIEAAGGAKA